jgi:hypothetical protein
VLLALDELHIQTDNSLFERLEETLPGLAFFAT